MKKNYAFYLVGLLSLNISYAESLFCKGQWNDSHQTAFSINIQNPTGPGSREMKFKMAKVITDYGTFRQTEIVPVRPVYLEENIYKSLFSDSEFRLQVKKSGDAVFTTGNQSYKVLCETKGSMPEQSSLCVSGDEESQELQLLNAIKAGDNQTVVDLIDECKFPVNYPNSKKCSPLLKVTDPACGLHTPGPGYLPLATERNLMKLLASNADVNAVDPVKGQTALHKAVLNLSWVSVDALIDYKAEINKQDVEGNTPLILAVSKNSLDKVMSLLQANARVGIRNNQGINAYELANQMGLADIIAVMEE